MAAVSLDKTKRKAATLLHAELLYEQQPVPDVPAIYSHLQHALPDVQLISDPSKPGLVMFGHPQYVTRCSDGSEVPAQTVLMATDRPLEPSAFGFELSQTFDWPAANEVVARCRGQLLLTEFLAREIEYRTRLRLFQTALLSVVELTNPAAVVWRPGDKLVDPAALRRASGAADPMAMVRSAVNVRMFRIENHAPGDMLMDTRGLAELGLPDLQVHFRGLEPDRVAAVLFNLALYLFQKGDVIADGHTVAGLSPGQKWKCQGEASLIGPERQVIDLNPGPPYAAGTRKS